MFLDQLRREVVCWFLDLQDQRVKLKDPQRLGSRLELVLASLESASKSEMLELAEEFLLVRLSKKRLGRKRKEPESHQQSGYMEDQRML